MSVITELLIGFVLGVASYFGYEQATTPVPCSFIAEEIFKSETAKGRQFVGTQALPGAELAGFIDAATGDVHVHGLVSSPSTANELRENGFEVQDDECSFPDGSVARTVYKLIRGASLESSHPLNNYPAESQTTADGSTSPEGR